MILKFLNIIIRIWSYDQNLCFREGFDSEKIKELFNNRSWKRVLLKFRIDLKYKDNKKEPVYHLHAGGYFKEIEYCWIPEGLNIPRFIYFPVDIMLICEFILYNFFQENKDYEKLRKDPEWIALIRKSQQLFSGYIYIVYISHHQSKQYQKHVYHI